MSLHYKALSHYFVAEGLLKSVGKFICQAGNSMGLSTHSKVVLNCFLKRAYNGGFIPRNLLYDILQS